MRGVQDSNELRRIVEIPRREWRAADAEVWADRWTGALARPPRTDCDPKCVCRGAGTMRLKPIQAVALSEIGSWHGGLFPIRVGGGKTLLSFLAARVLPTAKRPLLLLPAHLREKTQNEMRLYRRHWKLPPFIRVESYQLLSRIGGANMLHDYDPDLIIADEGHMLKNTGAACTKRVGRFLRERFKEDGRGVPFVVMSGTITKRSIRDFSHLSAWALRSLSPVPTAANFDTLDEWSRALDVNVAPHRRLAPGALSVLRSDPTEDVRIAFRRRLVQTPGVIATQEGPLPIELKIKSHTVDLSPEVERAYRTLRVDWTTPDEWPIEDGVSMWRHARELSTGFYSRWNPRPPDDWRDARREWASTCREIIKSNRRNLDTELQVRLAVDDRPSLYPWALPILRRWQRIAPTFEPNTEAVWFDDRTIDWIAKWAQEHGPALLWTERPAVGRRLAERYGLPYYANLGVDARTGAHLESHDPARGSAVVSIDANSVGRNLQRWDRNLLIDVPPNGAKWEQLLGRTHRDGQTASVIHVDVLFGCIEDVAGFWRAVEDSQYAEDMTGQAQKLVHADLEDVEEVQHAERRDGPQWQKHA